LPQHSAATVPRRAQVWLVPSAICVSGGGGPLSTPASRASAPASAPTSIAVVASAPRSSATAAIESTPPSEDWPSFPPQPAARRVTTTDQREPMRSLPGVGLGAAGPVYPSPEKFGDGRADLFGLASWNQVPARCIQLQHTGVGRGRRQLQRRPRRHHVIARV